MESLTNVPENGLSKPDTGVSKFDTISSLVATNKPLIKAKVDAAITAGSKITVIETDEQDTYANNWLSKCNVTMPVIQDLRKAYTGLLDDWKKGEMAEEKRLQAMMDEVRDKRNERANKKAKEDQAKAKDIEDKKRKEIEIHRIKSEQVKAVEIGSATRVTNGEAAIAKMFAEATLETIDKIGGKLNFTPVLKEDIFRGFLAVDYDNTLVSYEEFKEIVEKAYKHFNYEKCNQVYSEAVLKVIAKWKLVLPERKKELEVMSQAKGDELAKLQADQKAKADKDASDRAEALKATAQAVESKATEMLANDKLDTEFKSQVGLQEITEQDNTRSVISYRFPPKTTGREFIPTMNRLMMHVFADPAFKGIYKLDKTGILKRDAAGNPEYIEAVQSWLDLLAKVKPSPEFEGVLKTEDKTTIAKAKKEEF